MTQDKSIDHMMPYCTSPIIQGVTIYQVSPTHHTIITHTHTHTHINVDIMILISFNTHTLSLCQYLTGHRNVFVAVHVPYSYHKKHKHKKHKHHHHHHKKTNTPPTEPPLQGKVYTQYMQTYILCINLHVLHVYMYM